jgi:hypothetical protein
MKINKKETIEHIPLCLYSILQQRHYSGYSRLPVPHLIEIRSVFYDRHGVSRFLAIGARFLKNIQTLERADNKSVSSKLRGQLEYVAEMDPLPITLQVTQVLLLSRQQAVCRMNHPSGMPVVTTWDFLVTKPHRHASGYGGYIIFTPSSSSSFMSSHKQGQTAAFIGA